MTKRLATAIQLLLGAAGFLFLVIAFRETWDRSQGLPLPGPGHASVATALLVIGLVCAARGWMTLLGEGPSLQLAGGFYLSQLGKYLPGALWQPAGQLALATGAGIPVSRASAALPSHMVIQVAAGGTVAAFLSVLPNVPLLARFLSLLSIVPLVLLRRGWMLRVLAGLRTRISRIPEGELVPTQKNIARCYAWSVGTFLGSGTALVVLAMPIAAADPAILVLPAFALAWTVGFLAVPVPAGIGIREAVLIAIVGSGASAPLIAISLTHRLLNMIAEISVIAINRTGRGILRTREARSTLKD